MAPSSQGNLGLGSVVTALRPGSRIDVSTIIDLDRCPFLFDHTVHGSVLLPTALQIELVVAAISARLGSRVGLALTDIAVQDPVVLVGGSHRELRVVGVLPSYGAPGRLAVRGPAGSQHLSLHAAPMAARAIARRVPRAGTRPDLPGPPDLIYPPMFHGPAFQVIDHFGRRGDGLVSGLAPALPSWDLLEGGGQVAQLVELMLQTCGVWELVQTGRMMRPARIGRLEVSPAAAEAPSGVWAEVWPAPATPSAFDAVVRDDADRVLMRVQGYRPVELASAQPGDVRDLARHLPPSPRPTKRR